MSQSNIPQVVVDKDHELEGRAEKSTEALAKHRWHHILDPNGPEHTVTEYAKAIGRNRATVTYHARGYALWLERRVSPANALSLEDAFRLASQSVENQEFSEAIAEGSGQPVGRIARGDQAIKRNEIIERARQRSQRRGGDPVHHARDIAAEERRAAQTRRHQREEEKQRHTMRYIHIEGELANAQRRLMNALREADGVEFTDEEMELLRASIANIRAVLNLIDARMAGTPDIDWDAELTKLGGPG